MPSFLTIACDHTDVHLTNWVRGPGIKPGTVSEIPTQHTDYAATFLDLAGVIPHAGYVLDGHSMVPTLLGTDGKYTSNLRVTIHRCL